MQALSGWVARRTSRGSRVRRSIVVGEDDGEDVRADVLASRIRGARKVVIQKCGHSVPSSAASAREQWYAFLAELPR
jgi:hypothetical protein